MQRGYWDCTTCSWVGGEPTDVVPPGAMRWAAPARSTPARSTAEAVPAQAVPTPAQAEPAAASSPA